jgi:hypothetical protein
MRKVVRWGKFTTPPPFTSSLRTRHVIATHPSRHHCAPVTSSLRTRHVITANQAKIHTRQPTHKKVAVPEWTFLYARSNGLKFAQFAHRSPLALAVSSGFKIGY